MLKNYKVALIQLNAGNQFKENINIAQDMVKQAIAMKAKVICLPEVYAFRKQLASDQIPFEEIPGPSTKPFLNLAKQHNCYIICGSVYEKTTQSKGFNTTVVINPKGNVVATYRKIHLFSYHSNTKYIQESKDFLAGNKPIDVEIEQSSWGLSICYDVRFPELYRCYQNTRVLNIPASFTKPTGQAHWHSLCKARAIENTAFVCAANQVGLGAGGIESFGHSLIIDPWGNILAEADANKPDIITAVLDFKKQDQYRQMLPVHKHRVL